MKISWLKSTQDIKNFKFIEKLGFEVVKLDNQENIDQKIKELIENKKHLILESVHPSPLSANRGFFGSRPFSKTNNFLKNNGKEIIKW